MPHKRDTIEVALLRLLLSEFAGIRKELTAVRHGQAAINHRLEGLRVMDQETLDMLKEIDDETSSIGKEMDDLRSQIKSGMPQSDVADLKSRLGTLSSRLKGIAADPNNPVPEPAGGGTTTGNGGLAINGTPDVGGSSGGTPL